MKRKGPWVSMALAKLTPFPYWQSGFRLGIVRAARKKEAIGTGFLNLLSPLSANLPGKAPGSIFAVTQRVRAGAAFVAIPPGKFLAYGNGRTFGVADTVHFCSPL
jgi:hypothetical protein